MVDSNYRRYVTVWHWCGGFITPSGPHKSSYRTCSVSQVGHIGFCAMHFGVSVKTCNNNKKQQKCRFLLTPSNLVVNATHPFSKKLKCSDLANWDAANTWNTWIYATDPSFHVIFIFFCIWIYRENTYFFHSIQYMCIGSYGWFASYKKFKKKKIRIPFASSNFNIHNRQQVPHILCQIRSRYFSMRIFRIHIENVQRLQVERTHSQQHTRVQWRKFKTSNGHSYDRRQPQFSCFSLFSFIQFTILINNK